MVRLDHLLKPLTDKLMKEVKNYGILDVSLEQYQAVCNSIIHLLYESEARINEVLSLKLLDIKRTANGEADVHFYGKGKKHRITPLSSEIWNQFEFYCEKYHPVKNLDSLLFYSFRTQCQAPMD